MFYNKMNQQLSIQQSFNELWYLQSKIMRLLHHNTIKTKKDY